MSAPLNKVNLWPWHTHPNIEMAWFGIYVALSMLEARDALQVLARVRPWFVRETDALCWYLDERLPSLGELTPAEVIKKHGDRGLKELLAYIEAKNLGGFE